MDNQMLVILFLVLYLLFLAGIGIYTARRPVSNNEYLFGNGFGFLFSMFGIAASLFSSFTLQGMPDFFKNHGIGSWVFLGITDVCLAGLLLYFGLKMRGFARHLAAKNNGYAPKNLTEWLKQSKMPRWSIIFFIIATTIFMVPYVTIGIKGPAILLQSVIPLGDTHLMWSCAIVLLMLAYSWFGGIRAIFVTDMIQGMLLLMIVWAIAFFAIKGAGGVAELFEQAKDINPQLMSAPGPAGLFNWQFLLISFISIITIPYVQPQMATRMLVAKTDKVFARSSAGLAFFAFIVILPTLFIGLRAAGLSVDEGAVSTGNFLLDLINHDATPLLFGMFIVGALAADMSTVDSQLLSIGTEWRSAFLKEDIQSHPNAKNGVKVVGLIVALLSLALAQSNFESLILFAINSFVGTSLLLPLIVAAVLNSSVKRQLLSIASMVSVTLFLLSLFNIIPNMLAGYRIELYMYAVLGAMLLLSLLTEKRQYRVN